MRASTGLFLIMAGIVLVVAGVLACGWLSWFGRLPGDIRIERPNARVYIPLTSMLLVSVVLSLWRAYDKATPDRPPWERSSTSPPPPRRRVVALIRRWR